MIKKLEANSCSYLLSKVVHLGENYGLIGTKLEEFGFVAFKANINAIEEFANNTEELELHRKIVIERAKESFSNPFFGGYQFPELMNFKSPYKSQFLETLVSEINLDSTSNVHAEYESQSEQIRSLEIDPCLRNYEKLSFPEKEKRSLNKQEEFHKLRQIEIQRFLQPPYAMARPLSDAVVSEIAYDTFEKNITNYGFERNLKLSTKKIIFFTKPLIGDWMLNFTMLSNHWGFDYFRFEMRNGEKVILPKYIHFLLDLRLKSQKGFAANKLTNLPIKFTLFSPLGETAYSAYTDIDEMIVGIMGYTQVYGLLMEQLEFGLIDGIKELSNSK